MNTTKINFEEVNISLDYKFINKLGEEFAPTFDDNPMFIIKTVHQEEKLVHDQNETCGFKTETYIKENTFVMNVFKITNGWTATINGHFASDYNNYTITHISKFEF